MSTPRHACVLALMAACAGVVDLWAVTSLGGAFAGVVTGNLVVVGRGAGELRPGDLVAPAVAVGGFALGVAVWSPARRRTAAVQLAAELALLAALAVAWPFVGPTPATAWSLVLLVAAATAMGGQSSVALSLGESTTYLTGTLTGAVAALVADRCRRWAALRQLGALVLGATVAAVLLRHLWWSVPTLAAVLLGSAVALRPRSAPRCAARSGPACSGG